MRSDAWKTSWIFHCASNSNLYATGDITATTLKGPYCLGDNLLVRFTGSFRFVPSNHTCSPMLNGLKHGRSLTQVSCTLCCASWAAFLAVSMSLSHSSNVGMLLFLSGWCIEGIYPMRRLKGAFFVVADGHEFFVYCAIGK